MRYALWPQGSTEEFAGEVERILAGTFSPLPYAIVVAENGDGLSGFIEVSLRSHVDGCETHPVGYIEGWYVDESVRGTGVGRALVTAAEAWARAQGCTEMGSDALIDNEGSQRVHAALGYEVVDRCVNFRKSL
jgi:aminoglycoside 6'-N-acetyltransferase I